MRPPLSPAGAPDDVPVKEGRAIVNLTRHGQIRIDGEERSLRSFLTHVALELYPDRSKPAPRVLLRADGAAPWRHVMEVLGVLHRRGFRRVEFAIRREADGGDSEREAVIFGVRRDADAKPETGRFGAVFSMRLIAHARDAETPDLLERLHVLPLDTLRLTADREVEAKFGPEGHAQRVMRPLNVRFSWNGRSTYSFREVAQWIHKHRASKVSIRTLLRPTTMRAVVSVSEKVPSRYAIALLARLRELGWTEILFFERLMQEDDHLLGAPYLPYPATNRQLEGDAGLRSAFLPVRGPRTK